MSGFKWVTWRELSYLKQAEFVRYEHVQNTSKIYQLGKRKLMKKLFISAAIALLLLISITGMRLTAFPRTEASGTFITTSTTIHSVTQDKFNEIIELSSTVTYTGTIEGTSTLQGTLTVHRDESATFRGVETFTGLVNGIPGTLTFEVAGNSDLYQAIQLTSTITSGTGGLASIQCVLSMTGIIKDNGPVGTYTGQIDYE
jgi:hypothetical protein